MLHKCANPACASAFRSLRHGKLFLLETDYGSAPGSGPSPGNRRERLARRVERYWLSATGCVTVALPFLPDV
jgi:hypothetical protein